MIMKKILPLGKIYQNSFLSHGIAKLLLLGKKSLCFHNE